VKYQRSLPYKPGQPGKYTISRSKIELFTQCQRCFWLDARLGIKRPSTPPFQINKAIDELFKNEFDTYRQKNAPHPIMTEYKIDAIPYNHGDLDIWRNTFKGIRTLHQDTNLEVFGGVDDVWINPKDELIIVDYKATAKAKDVNLDADWQQSYKRQIEIYQWLFEQNGFKVNSSGYFVYANGIFDKIEFNNTLKFRTIVIEHKGSTSWVAGTLKQIKHCLEGDMPAVGDSIMGGECEYCSYAKARTSLTLQYIQKTKK
jgi:CRISPR/Cas system-associated exonuclease Cas4 (RecB family)